jgi:putative membrane protein
MDMTMHHHLPPPTWGHVLLSAPDWPPAAVCLLLAVLYAAGVHRLHRRGDRWPLRRTACWLAGAGVLFLVSGSGFAGYAMVLFSAHMAQHMVLNMYVPILLVLGAPVTLMLRVLPAGRGRHSARAILLRILHSRVLQVLSSMTVAVSLFLISLFALYFTPLFSILMSTRVGHLGMQVHFLLSGYLFFWTVIGTDPGPARPPHLVRLMVLLPINAAHAFFAAIVAFSGVLLGEPYLSSVAPGWISLRLDQQIGGAIAGGFAELPMIVPSVVIFMQWFNRMERTSGDAAPAEARLPA